MIGIIGATGLLGSCLKRIYNVETLECDITSFGSVYRAVNRFGGSVVINCAGITNRYAKDKLYAVNAAGPCIIQRVCDSLNKRMVHVSTDCVFSGNKGLYIETDVPDSDGDYGISKQMGEVFTAPHLTLRCSFVGLPDPKGNGLLNWFINRSEIDGYQNVYWNGMTVVEMAHLLMRVASDWDVWGLAHVFGSERLSKFDVLSTVADVYDLDIQINPADPYRHDKSLSTVRHDIEMPQQSFRQMVVEMRELHV